MAQTFFASYPSLTASANPSVGPNGQPIPGDSTLVAGENPSGNQQPLQTDSSGALLVTISTEPTTPLNVNLTEVAGSAVSLGQKTSANSLPVVIASDDVVAVSATALPLPTGASTLLAQTNVQSAPGTPQTVALTVQGNASGVALPISAASLPLPALAATSTKQSDGSQKTQIVDGSGNVIGSTSNALDVSVTNTVPVSGSVAVTQSTSPWVDNISQWGGTNTTLGSKVSASSVPVVVASDQGNIPVSQSTASALNATVVQGTAANLNATVVQGTAANLNATVVQTTASNLNAAVVGVGSAGTPSGGVLTVQGSSSGTPQPITQSTPTAKTVTQAAITVGTSAVRATVSGSAPAATRVVLVVTPDTASTATFYIGSSTVTNSGATRGVEIVAGQSFIANNDAGDYWIVSSTASQTVTIMEQA